MGLALDWCWAKRQGLKPKTRRFITTWHSGQGHRPHSMGVGLPLGKQGVQTSGKCHDSFSGRCKQRQTKLHKTRQPTHNSLNSTCFKEAGGNPRPSSAPSRLRPLRSRRVHRKGPDGKDAGPCVRALKKLGQIGLRVPDHTRVSIVAKGVSNMRFDLLGPHFEPL